MTLNSTGPISLSGNITGQSIALELKIASATPISLGDTAVRTLANVPSGTISMPANFYGKSSVITLAANYLIAAGGGITAQGGAGAGGLLQGSTSISSDQSYSIVVGVKGGGAVQYSGNGNNGADSSAFGLTAIGGGGGGGGSGSSSSYPPGSSGGSGGGGGYDNAIHQGGTGTAGQGNNGGYGRCETGRYCATGGGGGAGGAGQFAANDNRSPAGGVGLFSSISGSNVEYCRGANNFGGGTSTPGSGDQDGIVIVSYAGAPLWTGGAISTVGSNTVHIFSSSGTLARL